MKCPKCASENASVEALICEFCGELLRAKDPKSVAPVPAEPTPPVANPTDPRERLRTSLPVIFGGFALMLVYEAIHRGCWIPLISIFPVVTLAVVSRGPGQLNRRIVVYFAVVAAVAIGVAIYIKHRHDYPAYPDYSSSQWNRPRIPAGSVESATRDLGKYRPKSENWGQ